MSVRHKYKVVHGKDLAIGQWHAGFDKDDTTRSVRDLEDDLDESTEGFIEGYHWAHLGHWEPPAFAIIRRDGSGPKVEP